MVKGIDLFCGGGGSSWGAKNAGVEMVGAVDAWDIATRTYADNFSSAKRNVVNKPLDDDSNRDMFDRIGSVDLIIASPECTHHSIARGARPRDEESRRSGWYVMGFVDVLRPRWVVLENVTSMLGWPGFENLLSRLKALNYKKLISRGSMRPTLACLRTVAGCSSSATDIGNLMRYEADPPYPRKRERSSIPLEPGRQGTSPQKAERARQWSASRPECTLLAPWRGFSHRILRVRPSRRLADPGSSPPHADHAGSVWRCSMAW